MTVRQGVLFRDAGDQRTQLHWPGVPAKATVRQASGSSRQRATGRAGWWVRLVNGYDNEPTWGGVEALYVRRLDVGGGSYLDLNGLHLYYLRAEIDPEAVIVGGTPIEIPEPGCIGLLAFGFRLWALGLAETVFGLQSTVYG